MPKAAIPDSRKIEFADLIFKGKSGPQAAEELGITASQGKDWLKRDAVKKHLAHLEAKFIAKVEKKAIITREMVLQRYWEFASIDPSLTGYNTASQSKALDSVRDMLGWVGKDITEPEDGKPKGPDIFQPKWMKEPTLN